MTEEQRRATRRAKSRRKYARRRARLLGLPIPEFAVGKGGRPRLPEEQHLAPKEYLERRRERRIELARQKRRMMGVPIREELNAARRQVADERRLTRQAELAAKREAKRERRREMSRLYSQRRRALDPDRKREEDRRYRAEHREKVRAASNARKVRAKARGYRWKPTEQSIERHREYARALNMTTTAAHRYLVSLGLTPWWGPRETTTARRAAALAYAHQAGLLQSNHAKAITSIDEFESAFDGWLESIGRPF